MVYTHRNCEIPTKVYDVERCEEIKHVLQVDVDAGEVECAHDPVQLNWRGYMETFKMCFETIYPIFGGGAKPSLFHCYGRKATK